MVFATAAAPAGACPFAAIKRGVRLTSRSRPLQPSDLNRFDFIIGMDPRNVRDILKAANCWAEADKQLPGLEEVGMAAFGSRNCNMQMHS